MCREHFCASGASQGGSWFTELQIWETLSCSFISENAFYSKQAKSWAVYFLWRDVWRNRVSRRSSSPWLPWKHCAFCINVMLCRRFASAYAWASLDGCGMISILNWSTCPRFTGSKQSILSANRAAVSAQNCFDERISRSLLVTRQWNPLAYLQCEQLPLARTYFLSLFIYFFVPYHIAKCPTIGRFSKLPLVWDTLSLWSELDLPEHICMSEWKRRHLSVKDGEPFLWEILVFHLSRSVPTDSTKFQ